MVYPFHAFKKGILKWEVIRSDDPINHTGLLNNTDPI